MTSDGRTQGTSGIVGVVPPMITPFTEQGDIYEKGLDTLIDFLIEKGVHGLFCIGSYGSFPLMDAAERKTLTGHICRRVAGRVPVIIQVGTPATRISVDLAKHAEDAGAVAIASVVPYYYSGFAYGDDEIVDYFTALRKAVDLPVFLYNNPKTTGYHARLELVRTLVTEVGIGGMKDSSADFAYMVEVMHAMQAIRPGFVVIPGTASMFQPMYNQGSPACIAGTGNAFPEVVVSLYEALVAGDRAKAQVLQGLVIELRRVQAIAGFRAPAVYAMLRLRGIDAGTVRAPWREPNARQLEQIKDQLTKLDVL